MKTCRHCFNSLFHAAVVYCFFLPVLALTIAVPCLRAAQDEPIIEIIDVPLPFFDGSAIRNPRPGESLPPLRVLPARSRYWAQDGYIEAIVEVQEDDFAGELSIALLDSSGAALSNFKLGPPPAPRFVVYTPIPASLSGGGRGELEISWQRDAKPALTVRHTFRVEVFDEPAPHTGTIALTVPNTTAAVQQNLPATVGVPFPRGVLADTSNLRLLDEQGQEIPLQVMETARWSRFGTLKWVLCDFTVDLDGKPRQLTLEYGPTIQRQHQPDIAVVETEGFPRIEAGRLRIDDGVWYDSDGDGSYIKMLTAAALHGAFIEHEDGRIYRSLPTSRHVIEESGPERVVVLRQGWYREKSGDGQFCQFITRFIIHRDSPLIRIFHTWIFTGDGNRDRIANMGWQFNLAEAPQQHLFLTAFDSDGQWLNGDYLLQWDYDHFDVVGPDSFAEFSGGRAPGVAAARMAGDDVNVYFGSKDFWQNYPSELEFSDDSLWFHNWPRHNRPAGYTFDKEMLSTTPGPPPSSAARYALEDADSLTLSEWKLNAVQLRFAHEGEVLDFRLPDAFSEDPIWDDAIGDSRQEHNQHWERDDPETANAQGISRTEEMWLYFAKAAPGQAKAVLQGLNDETLRPIVDPVWVAGSGAFGDVHPQDWEQFPEEERYFEIVALTPPNWAERLGAYGMWIHGDVPAWNLGLANKTPNLYRAYREGHHGWPYPWLPFARSGDPRLLKIVEASTRQMIDAYYCHYVGDAVAKLVGPNKYRRSGRWERSLLPWAGRSGPATRGYTSHSDHFWQAWYMTGYHRARDIALQWGDQTKVEELARDYLDASIANSAHSWFDRRRGPISHDRTRFALTVSYLDMYEATHDPWFLVAAHEMIRMAEHEYLADGVSRIDFWRPWGRDFHRLTGSEEFAGIYLQMVDDPTVWHHLRGRGWGGGLGGGAPRLEPHAYAWRLSGDDYHLHRLAGIIDDTAMSVIDGDEPYYMKGWKANASQVHVSMWVPWYLRLFPAAQAVLAESGSSPSPIGHMFLVNSAPGEWMDGSRRQLSPVIAMKKSAAEPLPIFLSSIWTQSPIEYAVVGPDGEIALSGNWDARDHLQLEIPAAAPAGIYRFHSASERSNSLGLPLSEWTVPEVIELAPGAILPRSGRDARFSFMVPEGVEQFTIEFEESTVRRLSIWNPDGERVWEAAFSDTPTLATITVPPHHSGKLWRLSTPSANQGPRSKIDKQIPPIFAIDPHRWFDPREGVAD